MTDNNQNSKHILAVGFLKKTIDNNYRIRRISSMLLDHFIMCILIIPPAIILTIISENIGQKLNDGIRFFVFF